MGEIWKNYRRIMIPCEELLNYCNMADKYGDGHIFHHRYINADGESCERLSPENTVRGKRVVRLGNKTFEV